jgi:hypothetical protein
MTAAVVLFDLARAESPDDAAIEAFVHRLVRFTQRQASLAGLSQIDLLCAVHEFAARMMVSPILLADRTPAEPKLVRDLAENIERRALSYLSGQVPGQRVN